MKDNTNNESAPIGGVVVTGEAIFAYRLIAIRSALRLEMLGLKHRGRSALILANEVMGTAIRNKEECFRQYTAHLVLMGVLRPVKLN